MRNTRQRLGLIALSPLALALSVASVQAANRVDLRGKDLSQLNSQYQAATRGMAAPAKARDRHAELIGLDQDSGLNLLRSRKDGDGSTIYRYQQSFRGVPVFGEHVIVREGSDGKANRLFGRMVTGLASELPATAARIPASQALAIARRERLGSGLSTKVVQRESVTQQVYVDHSGRARMSYLVTFFADAPKGGAPTRPFVIVDAQNGAILRQWEGLANAEVGTGPGGNEKTGQYEYGTDYGYLDVAEDGATCAMDNAEVRTINLNHDATYPVPTGQPAFEYTCPRNTFQAINGAFSPANDAHYFGGVVFDMFNTYTGQPPITQKLEMRVHYSTSYENAFWDGVGMTFGDGASTFYPLVSLDVSAHEVGHGFTEQNSNLIYGEVQSGGINEAFSDMAGEAAEYYFNGGSNDFLVGAQIFKAAGEALRYMANPPQDGISIDSANDWVDGLDEHYSSGVYNKAFYTLATTAGWNTETAFKAFAKANQDYWTPSEDFYTAVCGVESAAGDLGYTVADVTAAFAAVDAECGGGPEPPTVEVLTKGVPVTGLAAATGQSLYWSLAVPAGATNLTFTISGGTGDADLYTKFGEIPTDVVWDCRPYKSGNAEVCTVPAPAAGTYYARVKAFTGYSGVSLVGNYSTGGGGDDPQTYTNDTDVPIIDRATVASPITVEGRTGRGPSDAEISVDIVHTYRGDLRVDLVAPDGSSYNLVNRSGGSADNVQGTFTKNLRSEKLNGTWKLRVNDNAAGDTGYINSWSITF